MTLTEASRAPRQRRSAAIVLAIHAAVFVALVVWSWRKWPDPIIDFGRELYVPWQITQGKVLYRDLASLFGPLSAYVNAAWFSLFGVSLRTLAIANLVVAAATFAGIYHLLRVATDRVIAAAATIAGMLLCGFSQYLDIGNYNFVTPYSHEATHGLALSVAALVALQHAIARRRQLLFALSGFCVGLVLLTKPEVSFAAAIGVLAAGAAALSLTAADRRALWRGAPVFAIFAAAGPIAFVAAFHLLARMTLVEAVKGAANGWMTASTSIARNSFYLSVSGLDHPLANGGRMIVMFGGTLATIAIAVALTAVRPKSRPAQLALAAFQAAFLVLAGLGFAAFEVTRALPLFVLAALAIGIATFARSRRDRDAAVKSLPLVMWPAFALAMLAKMLLNAKVYHYGFYLALPAVTCTVSLLGALVPLALDRAGALDGRRVRAMMLALVAVSVEPTFALANSTYRHKVLPVGSGADRFYATDIVWNWHGPAVQQALDWIDQNVPHHATMAVLPEGVMINYLSRHQTPIRFVNFMPPELMAFGESPIVAALDEHPPDYVLLVHRDTREYGYIAFGADPAYGHATMSWIDSRYVPVHTIGREPLSDDGYGIEIRRRVE